MICDHAGLVTFKFNIDSAFISLTNTLRNITHHKTLHGLGPPPFSSITLQFKSSSRTTTKFQVFTRDVLFST